MLLCSLANGTAYLRNHFDELEEDRKTHRKELMALKAKMKKCVFLLLLWSGALVAALRLSRYFQVLVKECGALVTRLLPEGQLEQCIEFKFLACVVWETEG